MAGTMSLSEYVAQFPEIQEAADASGLGNTPLYSASLVIERTPGFFDPDNLAQLSEQGLAELTEHMYGSQHIEGGLPKNMADFNSYSGGVLNDPASAIDYAESYPAYMNTLAMGSMHEAFTDGMDVEEARTFIEGRLESYEDAYTNGYFTVMYENTPGDEMSGYVDGLAQSIAASGDSDLSGYDDVITAMSPEDREILKASIIENGAGSGDLTALVERFDEIVAEAEAEPVAPVEPSLAPAPVPGLE